MLATYVFGNFVELFVRIMGYGGRRGTRLAEWGVGVIYRHAETLHMG